MSVALTQLSYPRWRLAKTIVPVDTTSTCPRAPGRQSEPTPQVTLASRCSNTDSPSWLSSSSEMNGANRGNRTRHLRIHVPAFYRRTRLAIDHADPWWPTARVGRTGPVERARLTSRTQQSRIAVRAARRHSRAGLRGSQSLVHSRRSCAALAAANSIEGALPTRRARRGRIPNQPAAARDSILSSSPLS